MDFSFTPSEERALRRYAALLKRGRAWAPARFVLRKLKFNRLNQKYRPEDGNRFISLHAFGLAIGKFTYGFPQLWRAAGRVRSIGSFTSIGRDVWIPNFHHPLSFASTSPFFYEKWRGQVPRDIDLPPETAARNRPIVIGNDVWIGDRAILLPPVHIGDGAVIATGSIVTKDVPPYAIVVGAPARVIRFRFDEATIAALLASRWWEWADDEIFRRRPTDIAAFLDRQAKPQ